MKLQMQVTMGRYDEGVSGMKIWGCSRNMDKGMNFSDFQMTSLLVLLRRMVSIRSSQWGWYILCICPDFHIWRRGWKRCVRNSSSCHGKGGVPGNVMFMQGLF